MADSTPKTLMRLTAIVDLYYLDAVTCASAPFGAYAKEKLLADAIQARDELAQGLADALYEYLWLIAWGEARHGRRYITFPGWYYKEIVDDSRGPTYQQAAAFNPKSNLPLLANLFDQTNWDGGYGGKLWKKLVDATMLYHKLPPRIFVDHVIDICHNNGLAFDKSEVGLLIPFALDFDTSSMRRFLNFKRDRDILTVRPVIAISNYISYRTYKILRRYFVLHNKKIPRWLSINLDYSLRIDWPTYKTLSWDNRILSDICQIAPDSLELAPTVTTSADYPWFYHGYKIKVGKWLIKGQYFRTIA